MRQARSISSVAVVAAAALVASLVLPALVLADPVSASPVVNMTIASVPSLATVVAEDAKQVADAAKAAEAKAAAEAAAKAAAVRAQAARAATARAASASKPATTAKRTTSAATASSSRGSELAQAQSILASLKAQYPRYLSGVTVSIGDAQGYQAISYYTSGRIVVSPTHKATLSRILNHEIWHIIDYRDNGRIDWRESVPPANAGSFR